MILVRGSVSAWISPRQIAPDDYWHGCVGRPDQAGMVGGNDIDRYAGERIAHGALRDKTGMKATAGQKIDYPGDDTAGQVETAVGPVGQQEITAGGAQQGAEGCQGQLTQSVPSRHCPAGDLGGLKRLCPLSPDLAQCCMQAGKARTRYQQLGVNVAVPGQQQAEDIEFQFVARGQAHMPRLTGKTMGDAADPVQERAPQAGTRSHGGKAATPGTQSAVDYLPVAGGQVGQGVGIGLEVIEPAQLREA